MGKWHLVFLWVPWNEQGLLGGGVGDRLEKEIEVVGEIENIICVENVEELKDTIHAVHAIHAVHVAQEEDVKCHEEREKLEEYLDDHEDNHEDDEYRFYNF